MVERQGNRVWFRVHCGECEQLFLSGDFNQWSQTQCPMQPAGDGWWTCQLYLKAGTYRFRYYSEQRGWQTDWAAYGVQRNHCGDWNSVLLIPRRVSMPVTRKPLRPVRIAG